MATTNIQEIKPVTPGNLTGPTTATVQPNATVQGQLGNILDSNSPLMQRARTRAAQEANKRGLLNSAMGVQAGEEAVLTAALPIAQQDAETYKTQALTNQDWQNKFGTDSNAYQYNSALSSQDYQQNYGLNQQKTESDLANIAAQGEQTRLNEQQKYEQSMGIGDYSGAGTIAADIAGQKELIQTKSELDLKSQTQAEQFQAGQTDVQLQADKEKYMAQLSANEQQYLAEIASREGISEDEMANRLQIQANDIAAREKEWTEKLATEVSLSEAEISARVALKQAEITSNELMQGRQIDAEVALQEAKAQVQKELQTQAESAAAALQEQRADLDLKAQTQAEEARYGLLEAEYAAKGELSAQESAQREKEMKAELNLRFENTKKLLPLETAEKIKEIQAQVTGNRAVQMYASSSQILTQFEKTIGDINNNKDLNDAARKTRINEAVTQLNASMDFLSSLDGIDLPDLPTT